MTLDLTERVKIGFPEEIEFPEILTQLCIWHESENSSKTVSGYFEFFEGDRDVIAAWVSQESAQKRFGMFGMSVDGGFTVSGCRMMEGSLSSTSVVVKVLVFWQRI